MKANTRSAFNISLLLLLLIFYSCKKNTVSTEQPIRVDSIAFAGNDTTILQPDNSVTLNASYKGQHTLKRVEWKKLIGYNSNIENPQGLTTKVSGLEGGTYEFELTVFDSQNNYGKDKISVTVSNFVATPNSVTFSHLSWVFNWSAQLEIPTFRAWVDPGKPFKVYVQRGGSTSWIEAIPYPLASLTDKYEYFIETRINSAAGYNYGSLYIFASGTDFSDRPKVKIEF